MGIQAACRQLSFRFLILRKRAPGPGVKYIRATLHLHTARARLSLREEREAEQRRERIRVGATSGDLNEERSVLRTYAVRTTGTHSGGMSRSGA